jgi:hypothetical protein
MRAMAFAPLALIALAGAASAKPTPAPVVHAASAQYSATKAHTIVVHASVDLPNSCWSNPRLRAPPRGAKPDAHGTMRMTVIVDSSEAPGTACSMIFRPGVEAPPLFWTGYPRTGLKAIKVIGSQTPVVAVIQPADAAGS